MSIKRLPSFSSYMTPPTPSSSASSSSFPSPLPPPPPLTTVSADSNYGFKHDPFTSCSSAHLLSAEGEVSAAVRHLRSADPALIPLIDSFEPPSFHRPDSLFLCLVRSIIYQQHDIASAAAIYARFVHLCRKRVARGELISEALFEFTEDKFRKIGASAHKAQLLKELACKYHDQYDGTYSYNREIFQQSDLKQFYTLTKQSGLDAVTAHLFMIFCLHRPDVLPKTDLGVRKGLQIVYGLEDVPPPSESEQLCERWKPYQSVGAWYMWQLVESKGLRLMAGALQVGLAMAGQGETVPISGGQKKSSPRFQWDTFQRSYFVELLTDYNKTRYRAQNAWTKEAWDKILSEMQIKFRGTSMSIEKIKDWEQRLEKSYRKLKQLSEMPGFEWDYNKHMLSASDEVWLPHLKEKKDANAWHNFIFPHYAACQELYKEQHADGSQSQVHDNNEVRPSLQSQVPATPQPTLPAQQLPEVATNPSPARASQCVNYEPGKETDAPSRLPSSPRIPSVQVLSSSRVQPVNATKDATAVVTGFDSAKRCNSSLQSQVQTTRQPSLPAQQLPAVASTPSVQHFNRGQGKEGNVASMLPSSTRIPSVQILSSSRVQLVNATKDARVVITGFDSAKRHKSSNSNNARPEFTQENVTMRRGETNHHIQATREGCRPVESIPKFSISKCIRVFYELQGFASDEDMLKATIVFKDRDNREIFLSLKDNQKMVWLKAQLRKIILD